MIVQYSPIFLKNVKKLDVRIYKSLRAQILMFLRNPYDPVLRNHELRGEWEGYRSINITKDWRALYEEIVSGSETIAYFSYIGTHKQLYGW
jgi:addiction module RelE/StbE family toxin